MINKVFAIIAIYTILFGSVSSAEMVFLELVDDDCIMCHQDEVQQIVEQGAQHKTEVGCMDCHVEHPPEGKNVVPLCSDCHKSSQSAHYAIEKCTICHNPHYPVNMDFAKIDAVKPACVSCHSKEGKENITYPSAHSDLDCKECHLQHALSTPCMDCHKPHTQNMTHKDCLRCHKPHRPTAIKYDSVVPSSLCAGCHGEVVEEVNERGADHKSVGCTDCHLKHPPAEKNVIPACALCHAPADNPHYKVENCISCHHPHYPAEMTIEKSEEVKKACTSCHPAQGKENRRYPSKHAKLDCNECHPNHGESKPCMDCHKPHTQQMTHQDCMRCHKPHRPTAIKYDAVVSSSLCAGCHNKVVKEVNERGTDHKSVACIDCHRQHPPSKRDVIPACLLCHSPAKKDHYKIKNCVSCHHPHYPMELDFEKIMSSKSACVSCHPKQGGQLQKNPSKHTKLDCNECHPKHRESATCVTCHKPHTQNMTNKDCFRCHEPHMPLQVFYEDDIPSPFCSACHSKESDDLSKTTTKHHELECTYCHKKEHKTTIQCKKCHGEPHSEDIHKKYSECMDCHKDAHKLRASLVIDKTADCVSCHVKQLDEVKKYPSAHAKMPCTDCHNSSHGEVAPCNQCHQIIHTRYINDARCVACHQPHSPLRINYSARSASNNICKGCHQDVGKKLSRGGKGHAFIQCATCHANKHGKIPECWDCHKYGTHSKEKFKNGEKCGGCHKDAHVL